MTVPPSSSRMRVVRSISVLNTGSRSRFLRQAKFLKHLPGNVEIGLVLLDVPFPFCSIRRDAVLTISLQGLYPTFAGRPNPQAYAATIE